MVIGGIGYCDIQGNFQFHKNIIDVLDRFVAVTNTEISKDDERLEEAFLQKNKTIKDHGRYFLPAIMNGVYDVDELRLQELLFAGQDNTRREWDEWHT